MKIDKQPAYLTVSSWLLSKLEETTKKRLCTASSSFILILLSLRKTTKKLIKIIQSWLFG